MYNDGDGDGLGKFLLRGDDHLSLHLSRVSWRGGVYDVIVAAYNVLDSLRRLLDLRE